MPSDYSESKMAELKAAMASEYQCEIDRLAKEVSRLEAELAVVDDLHHEIARLKNENDAAWAQLRRANRRKTRRQIRRAANSYKL